MERKGIGKARTPEPLKSPRLATKTSTLSLKRPPNPSDEHNKDCASSTTPEAGLIRSKPPTPGSFPKTKRTTPQIGKTTPKVSSAQRSKSPQPTPVSRYGSSKTTPRKTAMQVKTSIGATSAAARETPLPRTSGRARTPEIQAADKLQVAIRVRPYNQRETSEKCEPITINEKTISVNQEGKSQSFTFDECFWSEDSKHPQWASQRLVYEKLGKPLLSQALEGYNVSLMAYGQTGSGKSYSMMGLPVTQDDGVTLSPTAGIIPRFVKDLFDRLEDDATTPPDYTYFVEVSFCEIYNERIQDLLSKENAALRVREHPVEGPFIENLRVVSVTSFEALMHLINMGNRYRATASTNLNDTSSRSHSIFTVHLKHAWNDDNATGETRFSKMRFVDLAGSERPGGTEQCERWKEGVSINKSLLTLGKVITALAEGTYAPYRDSVLTFILKECLGGNAKTALLATVSPSQQHAEETLATLRYARGASGIINTPIINEEASSKQIKHLKEEIARLTAMQHTPHIRVESAETVEEIEYLKKELHKKEELVREINRVWHERLEEERTKNDHLDMENVPFPRLVKLHEDPQLNGRAVYSLPAAGETIKISRTQKGVMVSAQEHSATIFLPGVQVGSPHCSITCDGYDLIIQPMRSWMTHVNGVEIKEPRILLPGDWFTIGLQHFLWVQQQEGPYPDFCDVRQTLWERQEEKLANDLRGQYAEKCTELKEKATNLADQLKETEKQLQQEQDLNSFMKHLNDMETESVMDDSCSRDIEEMQNLRSKFQEVTRGTETPQRDRSPIRQIKGKVLKETRKIFENLEAEGNRIVAERMQVTGADGSDIKPAQLFAMVDEANQLVRGLVPRLCFSLEYSPESKITVKVTQTEHGTATFWCATKFHENLLKLKSQQTPSIGFLLQDPSNWVLSSKSSVGAAVYNSMNRVHRRLTDSWNTKRQHASTSNLRSGLEMTTMNDVRVASLCLSALNSGPSVRYTHCLDNLLEKLLAMVNALESLRSSTLLDRESLISWDSALMRCCTLGLCLRVQGDMISCNNPDVEGVEQMTELISTIQHLLGFVCQNKKLMVNSNLNEYIDESLEALKKLVYHFGALCIYFKVVPDRINNMPTDIKDRLKEGIKTSLGKLCTKAVESSKYSEVTVMSVIDNVQVTGRTRNQVLLDVLGMAYELTVAISMFFTNSLQCQEQFENEVNLELSILLGHNVMSLDKDVEKLAALTHGIYEGKPLLECKIFDVCGEIEEKISGMFPDEMDCNTSLTSLSFLEVVTAKGSSVSYIVKDILLACRRLKKATTKFYGLTSDDNRSFFNQTITP